MAQIKVPIVLDHDDLQRMVDEKIAELKAQFIPKADYEARLKADLKAILVELQLEIEESENCGKAFHLGLQMASNIIQQKINALEGNKIRLLKTEEPTNQK